MILHCISSGSIGNCYAIEINDRFLLLDCGVSYHDISKALNFKMSRIVGCLLTHEHGDHCKAAKELIRRGIKVYASKGTESKVPGCQIIEPHKDYQIGEFRIRGFDVPHDAEEPLGFLVHHSSIGLLSFITDAMYCRYTFPGLKYALIEANYSNDTTTITNDSLIKRIKTSHMSLKTCMEFLVANESALEVVVLLHLSDSNSDEELFLKTIKQKMGVRTYVATQKEKIYL